jgi:outer membrane protein assembly factor BamB
MAVRPDGTLAWQYDKPGLTTPPSIGADGTLYAVGTNTLWAIGQ